MKEIKNIGFFGFGLIGGSIARLLHAQNPNYHIFAYDRHPDYTNPGILAAIEDGVLSCVEKDIHAFADADLIFLCAPVERNIDALSILKPIISTDCILTDVGSSKNDITQAAVSLGLSKQFIGGHPMAGSDQTGYANSSLDLLENAYYILTPTSDTPDELTSYMECLVKSFRALCVVIDSKEHDHITAAISHVPHLIAAALVNLVHDSDDENERMRMLAAGGFKDITRIAASSPDMWQSICMSNRDSIADTLDQYIASLLEISAAVKAKDSNYLFTLFQDAGNYRSSIPNGKGMLNRIYEIFVDISDEPGAIATIAAMLGSNAISIKNIGIIHNREFEQGVLRIEFNDEEALSRAKQILSFRNYNIYER